jgi:hypothetical protein
MDLPGDVLAANEAHNTTARAPARPEHHASYTCVGVPSSRVVASACVRFRQQGAEKTQPELETQNSKVDLVMYIVKDCCFARANPFRVFVFSWLNLLRVSVSSWPGFSRADAVCRRLR